MWTRKGSNVRLMNYLKIQHGGFQAIQVLMECKLTIIVFYRSLDQEPTEIRITAKYFRETLEESLTIGK